MALPLKTRRTLMAVTAVAALSVAALASADGWLSGLWGSKPAAAPVQPAAATQDLGPLPATAAEALQLQANDRVIGQFGAPVTVVEYASFTCSHCADFHKETFPAFEREWLKTGKAVYVLRELPWDNLALGMSAVARCVPPEQYYPLVDGFFGAYKTLMTGNPLEGIKAVAGMAGLTGAQVDACIADANLQREVLRNKEIARSVLKVEGTPVFFINGAVIDGAVDYPTFKKALDVAYAQAKR